MILKLVYDKEIHVLELKPNESLEHVTLKVKDLFKKVPPSFVLTYKSPEQLEITFNSNREFDMFIEQMQGVVKIVKLFINEVGNSSQNKTQSEQKLEVQQKPDIDEEMTQKIQCSKEMDEATENFTNLHELNEEISQLDKKSEQPSKSQPQVTDKQFEEMEESDEPTETKLIQSQREEREQPSEREINTNACESSDPQDLRISSSSLEREQKQNLKAQSAPEPQQKEQPKFYEVRRPIFEEEVKERQIPSKHEPSEQVEQPIAKEHIQDDFLTHNVTCDICNVFPICGARFMCVICRNYNLCEKCEEKYEHEHPLLKLRYSFQTPVKVQVDIPSFRQRPKAQEKFKLDKVNLREMSEKQRRDRVLSLSSEISELLNKDLHECMNFVKANEAFSNETLIQACIEGKNPSELANLKVKKEQSPTNPIGNIMNKMKNIKNYIFSSQ